ncbi:MAG: pyridoxamine 5'-phosphate oxidase family protein [Rhodobacteraceae bacterium]|jgi:hypothetical protein|nr:pyridoxamine 5'-phosphate oxidase family protein [Paracoccaceae bacterium]
MSPDPHPWAATLATLQDQVWSRLVRGVHDRRTPARHPTLATVSPDGAPRARTVVLRGADRTAARLVVYTDLRSAKVADLRARAQAALHLWDAGAHLQVRLSASVVILTGDAVAHLWARLPEAGRLSYGGDPAPGQPVPDTLGPDAPTPVRVPDPAAFAVLHLDLQEMDVLHLGPRHRRAVYARADGWAGHWVAP